MTRNRTVSALERRYRALIVSAGAIGLASGLTPLRAQDRLFPARSASIGPVFERWSFGAGLRQPSSDGATDVELTTASAWSIPLSASLALGERWTFDVSTAYSSGTVSLRAADPSLGQSEYALSGFTDVRARLTSHIVGDNVVATLGANLPSGPLHARQRPLCRL